MKEKTPAELQTLRESNSDFQLIDVREPSEFETVNLEGELIPMGNILDEHEKIRRDVPVIIHCRSGSRSAAVINELEKRYGFENLYNLKGGITAWAREIDPGMQVS